MIHCHFVFILHPDYETCYGTKGTIEYFYFGVSTWIGNMQYYFNNYTDRIIEYWRSNDL